MNSPLVTLEWISNSILQISVGITWLCASLLILVYSVIFLRVLAHIFNRIIRKDPPQTDYIPTYAREVQTPHRSHMRKFPEEEEEDWEEDCFKNAAAV
jgi:hypothetical protein